MADRATNRSTFPAMAAAFDMFAAVFPGVKVKAVEEGGRTVGTFTPDAAVNPLYGPKPKHADQA